MAANAGALLREVMFDSLLRSSINMLQLATLPKGQYLLLATAPGSTSVAMVQLDTTQAAMAATEQALAALKVEDKQQPQQTGSFMDSLHVLVCIHA